MTNATLLSLPNEVLELICIQLHMEYPRFLLFFSLTCKRVNSVVLTFVERLLTISAKSWEKNPRKLLLLSGLTPVLQHYPTKLCKWIIGAPQFCVSRIVKNLCDRMEKGFIGERECDLKLLSQPWFIQEFKQLTMDKQQLILLACAEQRAQQAAFKLMTISSSNGLQTIRCEYHRPWLNSNNSNCICDNHARLFQYSICKGNTKWLQDLLDSCNKEIDVSPALIDAASIGCKDSVELLLSRTSVRENTDAIRFASYCAGLQKHYDIMYTLLQYTTNARKAQEVVDTFQMQSYIKYNDNDSLSQLAVHLEPSLFCQAVQILISRDWRLIEACVSKTPEKLDGVTAAQVLSFALNKSCAELIVPILLQNHSFVKSTLVLFTNNCQNRDQQIAHLLEIVMGAHLSYYTLAKAIATVFELSIQNSWLQTQDFIINNICPTQPSLAKAILEMLVENCNPKAIEMMINRSWVSQLPLISATSMMKNLFRTARIQRWDKVATQAREFIELEPEAVDSETWIDDLFLSLFRQSLRLDSMFSHDESYFYDTPRKSSAHPLVSPVLLSKALRSSNKQNKTTKLGVLGDFLYQLLPHPGPNQGLLDQVLLDQSEYHVASEALKVDKTIARAQRAEQRRVDRARKPSFKSSFKPNFTSNRR